MAKYRLYDGYYLTYRGYAWNGPVSEADAYKLLALYRADFPERAEHFGVRLFTDAEWERYTNALSEPGERAELARAQRELGVTL